ncbi:CheY-like protein [Suillus decipiens]|nr:CheY-like protein [Suillus decipiens]
MPSSTSICVRQSMFVPGWTVPPRVLLVDDDAVSGRLTSKFLQVFGCMSDIAVDGVEAVTKMNLEKYDLVLMASPSLLSACADIVMPKMDGVSATKLIRQFDHVTPIISTTCYSNLSDVMTYYLAGMNDIFPKPFTKDELLKLLDVRSLFYAKSQGCIN